MRQARGDSLGFQRLRKSSVSATGAPGYIQTALRSSVIEKHTDLLQRLQSCLGDQDSLVEAALDRDLRVGCEQVVVHP